MTDTKRRIEIFSAGCALCDEVVAQVEAAACPSCDIEVLDMKVPESRKRADELGVAAVPTVAIDGRLPDCCAGGGVDIDVLRRQGLGQASA